MLKYFTRATRTPIVKLLSVFYAGFHRWRELLLTSAVSARFFYALAFHRNCYNVQYRSFQVQPRRFESRVFENPKGKFAPLDFCLKEFWMVNWNLRPPFFLKRFSTVSGLWLQVSRTNRLLQKKNVWLSSLKFLSIKILHISSDIKVKWHRISFNHLMSWKTRICLMFKMTGWITKRSIGSLNCIHKVNILQRGNSLQWELNKFLIQLFID